MTSIKFCGLTRPEDAAYAASLGATHVGTIFAASQRQVSVETARKVYDAAGSSVKHVGVFGSASAEEIAAVAASLELDAVQLHRTIDGAFVDELRERFGGEVWQVVGVDDPHITAAEIAAASTIADAVLLDTAFHGRTGGTGIAFHWEGLASVLPDEARHSRLIVAGGLNPKNVADAIMALRPSMVDVSSGVESSPGIKDHNLMQAFAEAVVSASIV